jgi:hypothetical protein
MSFQVPIDTDISVGDNLKGKHAVQFTLQEIATLDFWLKALRILPPGDNAVADDILFRGLLVEHVISLLPDDPRSRAPADVLMLNELEQQFLQSLSQILEGAAARNQHDSNRFLVALRQYTESTTRPDQGPRLGELPAQTS